MSRTLQHAVVLGAAAIVTYLFTFVVTRVAPKLGAVVEPDDRRVHQRPTITGGGAAMFVGFLAALVLASRLPGFTQVFAGSSEALAVVVAAAVMFAIGAVDDLRELSAPAKVAGQVLSGSLLAVLGVTLFYFRVPFGQLVVLSADWATLITVLLVVVVANSVNLIDGLDGLAAGTVAIAAGAFYLYSGELQNAGLISQPGATISARDARDLPRLFASQFPSSTNLHGRRRCAITRSAYGIRDHDRRWQSC